MAHAVESLPLPVFLAGINCNISDAESAHPLLLISRHMATKGFFENIFISRSDLISTPEM